MRELFQWGIPGITKEAADCFLLFFSLVLFHLWLPLFCSPSGCPLPLTLLSCALDQAGDSYQDLWPLTFLYKLGNAITT